MSDSYVIAERRAVLVGPSAMAALRAERARQQRLTVAALERDRRLATAIRKTSA